jgi:hypothetical protein
MNYLRIEIEIIIMVKITPQNVNKPRDIPTKQQPCENSFMFFQW